MQLPPGEEDYLDIIDMIERRQSRTVMGIVIAGGLTLAILILVL